MPEKKDVFENKLNRNYGAVQKKELLVANNNIKLVKEFSSNTADLSKKLKQEMKDHTTADKDIIANHNKFLKELTKNHTDHLKGIDLRVKGFNTERQANLKSSINKFDYFDAGEISRSYKKIK